MLEQLASNGVRADAVLFDLGVSSMQIDQPERGFSYAADAPLDMRMDPNAELSARELVNEASERDLTAIFRDYGEERYARQIARAVGKRRREQPFERTGELVDTIKAAIPAPARFGDGHPAKRVFQALRIAVNDELGSLEAALPAGLELLRPGGPPLAGAGLHVPSRLPRLRVRPGARSARSVAPRHPAVRAGDRRQPARRVRSAARRRQDR